MDGPSASESRHPDRLEAVPLFRFDPGYLFLAAGIVLIAAAVLIPARYDLRQAEWNRDRARAVEAKAKERLARYAEYLDALAHENRTLVVSLAATQLNLAPADRGVMIDASQRGLWGADVFAGLEPGRASIPPPVSTGSVLERWSVSRRVRPWLLAGGALLVLIGFLPPSRVALGQAAA